LADIDLHYNELMQAAIFIPTYVGSGRKTNGINVTQAYDHMTPLNYQGQLHRCLASLVAAQVELPVYLLIVAEQGLEEAAGEKVATVCRPYTEDLAITLMDYQVETAFHGRLAEMGYEDLEKQIGLGSYGAIRNFGLSIACALNLDVAIWIDDDEVVEDPDFARTACYGLGGFTPDKVPILVKSGYYLDKRGKYTSPLKSKWYNHFWTQGVAFNKWIESAMRKARLSSSNNLYGGLFAVHREAFSRVAFDPWISRGEDLDYLINILIYGGVVFFDNKWQISHLPPAEADTVQRFDQDVYRWIYEYHKIESSKSQFDLYPIRPGSLTPYPGTFLDRRIMQKVRSTSLLRALAAPRNLKRGYLRSATKVRSEAIAYAEIFCQKYYDFQKVWPLLTQDIGGDIQLRVLFGGTSAEAADSVSPGESSEQALVETYREENQHLLDFELDMGALTKHAEHSDTTGESS
jgi:hypothetical protein